VTLNFLLLSLPYSWSHHPVSRTKEFLSCAALARMVQRVPVTLMRVLAARASYRPRRTLVCCASLAFDPCRKLHVVGPEIP